MPIPDAVAPSLFKATADQSFNAITVTRAQDGEQPGEIVYVNEAFTEMTGYEAEEVLGKTPGMLQGPKTDPEVLDRLARKIERGDPFHGETTNYRKDGSEFIIEWKVMPIEQDGATTYHVAVQRDVTARREQA
ncbi:MAG: PAS domain-containing protein [Salinibacter sp.]